MTVMRITAFGHHRGPVIRTSNRIGIQGPEISPYSYCGWAPSRPSNSDFDQNWNPGTENIPLLLLLLSARGPVIRTSTRNIPLLLLRLGAIEAQ
jgi:hypothetical protein